MSSSQKSSSGTPSQNSLEKPAVTEQQLQNLILGVAMLYLKKDYYKYLARIRREDTSQEGLSIDQIKDYVTSRVDSQSFTDKLQEKIEKQLQSRFEIKESRVSEVFQEVMQEGKERVRTKLFMEIQRHQQII